MNKFIKMSVLLSSVIITNDILHAQSAPNLLSKPGISAFLQNGQVAGNVIVFGKNKYSIELDGKKLQGVDLQNHFEKLKKAKNVTPHAHGSTAGVYDLVYIDDLGNAHEARLIPLG